MGIQIKQKSLSSLIGERLFLLFRLNNPWETATNIAKGMSAATGAIPYHRYFCLKKYGQHENVKDSA